MEMLSKTPYIVQMYDVISESDMRDLRAESRKKLKRSAVVDTEKPGVVFESLVRTSVEGWVYKPYPKLSKFIEFVTGLSVEPVLSAEAYLVAEYAFGGHYDCHLDAVSSQLVVLIYQDFNIHMGITNIKLLIF